jgi:beta-aspartyl-peptidase (threonine type)
MAVNKRLLTFKKSKPAIIVHGGAGPIRDDSLPERLRGCEAAARAGWEVLQKGGTATDAVEAAVVVLEDNPLFNAGTGSALNSLGKVEMDAAIREGQSLRAGAVAAVSGIKNPIKLARRVMEDGRHVMIAGKGASLFARQVGIPLCAPRALIVEREKRRWQSKHGTVGCVAFDKRGQLAVGTSTGGIFNKLPGRVGDSPLIGCGTYADDLGAASCTGQGEAIIRLTLAKYAVDCLGVESNPQSAAESAIDHLGDERIGATGGIIMMDRLGNIGFARNTSHMPVCAIRQDETLVLES